MYYDYVGVTNNGTSVSPEFLRPPQPRGSLCGEGYWQTIAQRDTWSVYGFTVDYCLSEKTEEQCSLDLVLHLLLAMVVFNLLKVTVIAVTLLHKQERPLLTIGDAITSFITDSDKLLKGCLLNERDVKLQQRRFKRANDQVPSSGESDRQLLRQKLRPFQAASKVRWAIVATL
jgi:hypothetical protein